MIKINKNPLKGFKDYYPEDFFQRKHLFDLFDSVSSSFGYLPYDGPVIENSELYEAKSGDSIAYEESYRFNDKSGRSLTLRPEMTPTFARMVAKKSSEFKKPIRMYSIPVIFRYEKPQKGRSREFFQYNADIVGVSSVMAELEIILLSVNILEKLGIDKSNFVVRVNDLEFMKSYLNKISKDTEKILKLIDRKEKLTTEDFENSLLDIVDKGQLNNIYALLDNKDYSKSKPLNDLFSFASSFGINLKYDPTIVRGFDYYSGIVFEIWDKFGKVKRSLFGGGRYDNLISLFGGEKLPSVGVGCSDTVLFSVMSEYGINTYYDISYDYFISTFPDVELNIYANLATKLRSKGSSVLMNVNQDWNLSKQLEFALAQKCVNFIIIGKNELKNNTLIAKNLLENSQQELSYNKFFDE